MPDAVIDLRYATPNNFVGVPMYPAGARCLVDEVDGGGPGRRGRRAAARRDVLVFWDCYRPHDVQVRMYEAVSDPAGCPGPGPTRAAMRPGCRWT